MMQPDILRLKSQFLAKVSVYSDWQALNFPGLLAQVSDDAFFAGLLGKTQRTITSWRKLQRVPSPRAAAKIIVISGNALNVTKIYTPYIENLTAEEEATI